MDWGNLLFIFMWRSRFSSSRNNKPSFRIESSFAVWERAAFPANSSAIRYHFVCIASEEKVKGDSFEAFLKLCRLKTEKH